MSTGIINNILLYIESSEASMYATELAIALAKMASCQLTAMYVVDIKTLEDLVKARVFVRAEELDFERDLEEDGKRYLAQAEEMAESKRVSVSTVLCKGEIPTEVASEAEIINADLIVIGAIEELKSRKDVYFDAGERILREANCPVIAANGPGKITQLYKAI